MANDSVLRIKLGQKIREIRSLRGMTGKKLAEISKISPAYLSEVERGLSEVSGEKLTRIAEALGVSVGTLISPEQGGDMVSIPSPLLEAAEELGLSLSDTVKILRSVQTLVARRSSGSRVEWNKDDWIQFYRKVEFILTEEHQ